MSNKIRAKLVAKGISNAAIARKAGVTRSAIQMTIKGVRKNPRLQQAIADELGSTPDKLWKNAA